LWSIKLEGRDHFGNVGVKVRKIKLKSTLKIKVWRRLLFPGKHF
jgi:hypothetical protein